MHFRSFITSLLLILSTSHSSFACEGECITGITDAFYTNYSVPVTEILHYTDNKLRELVSTSYEPAPDAFVFLNDLNTTYADNAPPALQHAIFPSYFHGKCQKDGEASPPGCPNPDCPVLCGTPGSMVHFYDDLVWIAFNDTRTTLQTLINPDIEDTLYYDIEGMVVDQWRSQDEARDSESQIKVAVKQILDNIPLLLENYCGGRSQGDYFHDRCRWENEMKEFILTFP